MIFGETRSLLTFSQDCDGFPLRFFFLRIYFFCFSRELLWGGYRAVCYADQTQSRVSSCYNFTFSWRQILYFGMLKYFTCWKLPVWDPHVSRDQGRILSNNLKWPKGMRSSNIIDTGGDRYGINTSTFINSIFFRRISDNHFQPFRKYRTRLIRVLRSSTVAVVLNWRWYCSCDVLCLLYWYVGYEKLKNHHNRDFSLG